MNATALESLHIIWVCHSTDHLSSPRGVFYGDDPLKYAVSTAYAQLIISALLSAFVQHILTPLGESAFVSMLLVGFFLGPSLWGNDSKFLRTLYPMKGLYVNQSFSFMGSILFMFVVGIKMDLSIVRTTGKKAVIIGFLAFAVPLALNLIVARFLRGYMTMDLKLLKSIYYIAAIQAVSSFHVIVRALADLNLLNSELGRLSTSSAMVSGMLSWIMIILVLTVRQSSMNSEEHTLTLTIFSSLCLIALVCCVMRPIMMWMVRRSSDGKPLRESYSFAIFLMILGCTILSEFIGLHFIFGAMVLGIAVPDGPPLGSALVNKLESVVTSILLPSYFVSSVSGVNLLSIHPRTVLVISILGVTSFIAKILAVMLPSLYSKMSPLDSLSLALIMSSQGITDVMLLQHARLLYVLDQQCYSIMVTIILFLSGIFTPLIKVLYKPSKLYLSCRRRTIQHANPNMELRMLACVYHQDYTPSLISLVEMSHPMARSPICCYVMHLIELTGRSSPLLIHHRTGKKVQNFQANYSSHIINAFRSYEQRHARGIVMVNLFTAISPFSTIDEEVCGLALDKRTSMLIIPFHKQWKIHGVEEFAKFRAVNQRIIEKAPCSVGILVDRGNLGNALSKEGCVYNIGMIFVQGKDDREALAYAMRMAKHPHVNVTVVHVTDSNQTFSKPTVDMELDEGAIAEFRIATVGRKNHFYKQEWAKDSIQMVSVIRSLENTYDLILVGRRHDAMSPLFTGLSEWNEFPELGFIGDMLASPDSNCKVSALVVQQHMAGVEDHIDHINYYLNQDSIMGGNPPMHPSTRVFPFV